MKILHLALGMAVLGTATRADEPPRLAGTGGAGLAIAGQRYDGPFGDNITPYIRAHLEYHPMEWLGTRVLGGFGNISNGTDQFRTESFSNLGIQLLVQPRFEALGAWRPYLGGGVSSDFGKVKVDGRRVHDLDWHFYLPVELGVEWIVFQEVSATAFLENRLCGLNTDRPVGFLTGSSYTKMNDALPRLGLGLTWRLGGSQPAPQAPIVFSAPPAVPKEIVKEIAPPAVPVDADKDGVPDSLDRCPATPAGLAVTPDGCPLDADRDGIPDFRDKCPGTLPGTQVTSAGCPVDSDRDGVPDQEDLCPGTPAGAKVTTEGCPIDSDKDSVPDGIDQCPGTIAGTKVDTSGCLEIRIEHGARNILAGVKFATGKADLDSSCVPTLAYAAKVVRQAPEASIEIAGFTDSDNRTGQNLSLSTRRAETVRDYLVGLGVPAEQLSAKGYASAEPIADNATPEGRAKNRRIELRVK